MLGCGPPEMVEERLRYGGAPATLVLRVTQPTSVEAEHGQVIRQFECAASPRGDLLRQGSLGAASPKTVVELTIPVAVAVSVPGIACLTRAAHPAAASITAGWHGSTRR